MPQNVTIPLEVAKKDMRSVSSMYDLLRDLEDLSPVSIKELAPLMFAAIKLESRSMGTMTLGRMIIARPEWINQQDGSGNTPLMEATKANNLDMVELLLAAGAKTDPTNWRAVGVLDMAGQLRANRYWQQALGNLLLENGEFSQAQKDKALRHAAYCGNPGMVRSLLDHGARLAAFQEEETALSLASGNDDTSLPYAAVVKMLLQAPGANAIIDHGWGIEGCSPALCCASSKGILEIMGLLLEAGARVNCPPGAQVRNSTTPLLAAAFGMHADAIEMLIKAGADATAVDEDRRNALHLLAATEVETEEEMDADTMLKALGLLVAAGADPLQVDASGALPLDIAREKGRHALADGLAALVSSHRLQHTTPDPDQASSRPGPRL